MTKVHVSIHTDRDTTVRANAAERPTGPPNVWLDVGPGVAHIFLVPESVQELLRALVAADAAYADHYALASVETMDGPVTYTSVTLDDYPGVIAIPEVK